MCLLNKNGGEVMKSITMADIAKETGYSVNTISHALNDKSDISEKTKEYIRETAEKMGYIRNISASALRSGKSKSVAVIVGDISNPHFSVMIKEIEAKLREYDYTAIILNTDEDEKREKKAIVSAIEKNVDGIIICPVQKTEKNIKYLEKNGIKHILIGRRFAKDDENYVVCDDENGGFEAADYFLKKGCRKILFLNGPLHISGAKERLIGIKSAFAKNKVELSHMKAETVTISNFGGNMEIQEIIQQNSDADAVICFSDLIGMEACRCIINQGRKIPEEVEVIGFDNIASKFSFPMLLSSVTASKTYMSEKAVELLMSAINGERQKEGIVLPTKLVLRETTKER